MNRKTLFCVAITLAFFISQAFFYLTFAQSKANRANLEPITERHAQRFFAKNDLMLIGAFYYPEQWPREQWERDLNNMAKFGFDFTHMAEFAWTFLEPEEGRFEFGWLDEAIGLAAKAGLKVILCTPSLAPPAWVGEKYPETFLVNESGVRMQVGVRANSSITNPKYRELVARIVAELGKRYGQDTRVWGWQLDNEPLAVEDYSPSARVAFQQWLKKRYGTIEKMNEVWGGSFWSTRFNRFEQVLIPNQAMNGEDKLSPHALLDFKRFTAEATAQFLNEQADILRKFIGTNQFITTNYTNATQSSDPRLTDHLDFPSYTLYPVSGANVLGGNSFRIGNPYRLYEACDYFRPIKGVTGVMELQPGQVNWGSINPMLQPGVVHMWIIHALGGGCSFVCTYRYRHPLFSSEMYHDGIVGTDGVTLSQGGSEFVQAIQELKTLRLHYNPNEVMPIELKKRRTAFLWSHEAMWDLNIQPQTTLWSTWGYRNRLTSAVKSAAAPMDFIAESDDFSAYPFLVVPPYPMVDKELVSKWERYVENGGHLIVSCRTGQKDKRSHFFEGSWAEPLLSLIGARVDFFDMLPPSVEGTISAASKTYRWNCWGDVLSPLPGTEVLATYSNQFYSGKAAAVTRKLGRGTVTYIGVYTTDGELERELIRNVYLRAGVEVEDLPRGVYLDWRDGFFVGTNYSNDSYAFKLSAESKLLIGTNPLQPGQALVWKRMGKN
jgi:beta-galactosidase